MAGGIHYVDFSGDLRETVCGLELGEVGDSTTLFMSEATCPECRQVIAGRIEELRRGVELSPGRSPAQSFQTCGSIAPARRALSVSV
jgi:hypothetical protein